MGDYSHQMKSRVRRLLHYAESSRRTKLGIGAIVRRAARWLELRSFGLTPEHFTGAEGLRAALAVAFPLILIIGSRQYEFGWAVFAAFWTCLCDNAGPDRLRRFLLAVFVCAGAAIAFVGSWVGSFGTPEALATGPLLVFLSALLPYRLAQAGTLSVLLGVVGVVAIGFPLPFEGAAKLALSFLLGSAWAYLLINVLWRIDAWLPVRKMTSAVFSRLSDMIAEMVATRDGSHPDAIWHPGHAEHRRSVRIGLERLRQLLSRYKGEPDEVLRPFLLFQDAAETLFSAAIALEHDFVVREGPANERVVAARAMLHAVVTCQMAIDGGERGQASLRRQIGRLQRSRSVMSGQLPIGCLIAAEQALRLLVNDPETERSASGAPLPELPEAAKTGLKSALQQALRQASGVVAVYYVATVFRFGYPYWATMAVIVVMQGAARMTWTRALERIFGSLLGGAAALSFLLLVTHPYALAALAVPLAGVSIALRSVNYTVFVLFLTMLFVIVTELLQPGVGIASARILDNTVGSLAALLAALLLWPKFDPPLATMIGDGMQTNRDYIDAVTSGRDETAIYAARRRAGLASTTAEVALHDLGGLPRRWQRLSNEDAAALRKLRLLAGEAAAAWHRRLAAEERSGA
ncbi:hypothetical protein FHS82_002685 [Pseudochelatococcus lubricantis]|uniref:Integral membrane bound transporter domain-containing protein n=1 Tax=Pseudochelatococcus lubricantis TaxID=1538102 RepID=A0ABX0V3N2_9HYPH|nr:hypothetical protein [Pseudochelatococcus lubricantis]